MGLCGPRLSLCCLLLSVWGIVQLFIMGIFFYMKSVALVEDLPLRENYNGNFRQFYADLEIAYSQNAYNCWIATCVYVATLLISLQQFYSSQKATAASF